MLGVEIYPACAETEIGFDDYGQMHRENHTSVFLKNSPRWAFSDVKLRLVIAHKICIMAGVVERPTTLDELRKVEEIYLLATGVQAAKPDSHEMQKHLDTLQRHGGPLQFFIGLLYKRYRLGMDSPALAREYGITPQNVRQQINKCSVIARSLFPDTEDHLPWHHSANKHSPTGRTAANFIEGARTLHEKRFGVSRAKKIRLCIVCGKECPKQHSKFCDRKCYHKDMVAKQKAARAAARPAFCSPDCKKQFAGTRANSPAAAWVQYPVA